MKETEQKIKELYVKLAMELITEIDYGHFTRTQGEAFYEAMEFRMHEMKNQPDDMQKIDLSKIKYSFVKSWRRRLGIMPQRRRSPEEYQKLEKEYIEMANYRRSFEANRQMFKLQNNNLSNVIQTLGRV